MIRTTNGIPAKDVTSPTVGRQPGVIETAEQFNLWKGQLLRQLRSADLVVKIALSLPLFLPAFLIWSLHYWSSQIKIAIWNEIDDYLMIIAFVLIFPYYYYFKGLTKLARRNKKRRSSKIDWSKEKYRELATAITNSGVDLAKITGELAVDDSWNIHIYPRHREFLSKRTRIPLLILNGVVLLLSFFLSLLPIYFLLAVLQVLVLSIMLGIVLTLDLVRPRLTLVITTRVLTFLKGASGKFRLVISHELSHIRHRDPVSRVIWQDREDTGAFLLFWFGIFFILQVLVMGNNLASGWVFISCMFGWFIALLLISDLIPLLQELRADLEAIKSTSERELLIQVLRVVPIESKHQTYLNRSISLRQILSVIKDASHHFRISDQKEVMRQRIAMLETGEIALISAGRLHLKLLAYYVVAITTIIASQIYIPRIMVVP